MLKRTPLFAAHQRAGARLVEFGGWEMPVQYTSITDEHLTVRRAAGIFDISHMGELRVSGQWAADFLNETLTNDVRKLAVGQAQYTLMCNDKGGTIDDLYVYRLAPTDYLLIVNASRTEPDVQWLQPRAASSGVDFRNVSEQTGAVAVQGPAVQSFIDACFAGPATGGSQVSKPTELKKNQVAAFGWGGETVWLARTGYTGEDGFEIVAPAQATEQVWETLLKHGRDHGLKPTGLGARDTLRTEVCYPLYGHELDEQTSPIEAGLGYFVALDKPHFTGKTILSPQKAGGPSRKLIAFKANQAGAPPRAGYGIWSTGPNAANVGTVTSGTLSPSLGMGIGLGYVPPALATPGTPLEIEVRGRRWPVAVVQKPIYRKS